MLARKAGAGNRRVNVNLDFPSQAFALSKSGQKIIFQKEYKCANIFKRLKVKFSFCKIQENRGVAVNLGFASASVPRKNHPQRPSFRKISAFNVTKIPPCLFHVPKNPVPKFHELMLQDFFFSYLLP